MTENELTDDLLTENELTEEEKKAEIMYRFRLLSEMYPDIALPHVSTEMSLSWMKVYYETIVRKIEIETQSRNLILMLLHGFDFIIDKYGDKYN